MLSKSRGHVLRTAAILHVLFCYGNDTLDIPDVVSESAIRAATDFIKTSCQQIAYIAGRGLLADEIEKYKSGKL